MPHDTHIKPAGGALPHSRQGPGCIRAQAGVARCGWRVQEPCGGQGPPTADSPQGSPTHSFCYRRQCPALASENAPRTDWPSQRWGRWAPHGRLSGPASCLEMLPRPSCLVLPINVENTGRGGRGLCRPLLSGSGDEGCHSGPCHGRHGAQNDSLGRGLGRHGAAPGAARGVVHGDCRPTERVSGNKHFMTFFSYKYALEQLIKQAHKGAGIK